MECRASSIIVSKALSAPICNKVALLCEEKLHLEVYSACKTTNTISSGRVKRQNTRVTLAPTGVNLYCPLPGPQVLLQLLAATATGYTRQCAAYILQFPQPHQKIKVIARRSEATPVIWRCGRVLLTRLWRRFWYKQHLHRQEYQHLQGWSDLFSAGLIAWPSG